MSATKSPLSEIISISDLPWQERQPGIRMKSLWEDAAKKRRAVLSRIEPDATAPLHRHVGDELIFVIEGALSDEFGTVTAGSMGYRPNGCVHTISTKQGATGRRQHDLADERRSGTTRPERGAARSSRASSRAPRSPAIGTSATS